MFRPTIRSILRPWIVAFVLCVLYLTVIVVHYQNGPLEFARPTPDGQVGYDGQFTYYIALDPANASPRLDVPAYRYQRILHPLLADVLSLGQANLIPWMIVFINLIALAAGTAALEQLLIAERVSRWYALVYGLFGGIFFAVRVDTAEPLAYGLVLLAILAGSRRQLTLQALLLALALFAKETTVFFVIGYLLYYAVEHHWRDILRLLLICGLPFTLWQGMLRLWLGQFGIGSGGAMATPFELLPFNGIWRIAASGAKVFIVLGLWLLAYAVLPALWGLWQSGREVLRHDVQQRSWQPYTFLLLANAVIMLFVPFSTYREPLGIARFMPGLVISLILYAALRKQRRVLTYSSVWVIFGLLLIS